MRFSMSQCERGLQIGRQQSPELLRSESAIFRRSRLIPIEHGALNDSLHDTFPEVSSKGRGVGRDDRRWRRLFPLLPLLVFDGLSLGSIAQRPGTQRGSDGLAE